MDMLLNTNKVTRIVIDDVLVQYQIFDTNSPVMVTFPPGTEFLSKAQLTESKPAWAFKFFAKQKMNVIAFNHIGEENYFDSPALAIFIQKLSKELEVFPEAIGYGVSRGGFATALFADRLQLSRALLLMPVSTYNSGIAVWDPKLKQGEPKSRRIISLDATVCKTPLTIIYDPLHFADRRHKQRFLSCVEAFVIPGVGHRIARALQDMGMLKNVVLEFRQGGINAQRFFVDCRKRHNLSYYFRNFYKVAEGKLTPRRLFIIYNVKLQKSLNLKEFDIHKIKLKLLESTDKRVNKLCAFIHNKSMLTVKTFAGSGALFFC
ncbi:hypothetical protein [Shewanella donghaensis]|uniref:hypothetical protein n=1 Tax=Shewanella donghaensis TaxID=238836 RepID=UPI0013154DC5|nr:hypothetical protein [Shewanella donghaensis]